MGKTLTHEEFLERLNKVNKNIEPLEKYINTKTKILFRCKVCGCEWKSPPCEILTKKDCPKCAHIKGGLRQRKTHEQFVNEIQKINPRIKILSRYEHSHTRIDCKCQDCENVWDSFAYNLTNGAGCPECGKNIRVQHTRKTYKDFLEQFYSKNSNANNIEIVGEYISRTTPIECHCKICNQNWLETPSELLNRHTCPVCTNKRVVKGFNDINTTRPDLTKYFVDINDSYKYVEHSNKKLFFQCPYCSYKKEMRIYTLSNRGFSCQRCSDKGYSYPNRFSYAFLSLLPIKNHQTEYSPEWIAPKRYDNYFEYKNKAYILEMDGGFHYKGSFSQNLEEIQENDNYKTQKAMEHNIEVIRIECKQSMPEYIKNNILQSRLADIFDLKNYDWEKCYDIVKAQTCTEIWDYVNQNPNISVKELCCIFHKNKSYIMKKLYAGNQYGMCDYKFKHQYTPILVYKNNKLVHSFQSLKECGRQLREIYSIPISPERVANVCKGLRSEYKGFVFKYGEIDDSGNVIIKSDIQER